MTLKKTVKPRYAFEISPNVTVESLQNIRVRKDGVEVTLSVQVHPLDKDAKVEKPDVSGDGDLEKFVASIEKGKVYKVEGEEMTVKKVGKKKVKLENDKNEIELTPEELFNQAE